MAREDLGKVRLEVESSAGTPVFVGIARTSDVDDYLSGTSYTEVTDVDYSPFNASYRDHDLSGDRRPALPPIRTSGPPRPMARARRPSPGISRTVTGRSSS